MFFLLLVLFLRFFFAWYLAPKPFAGETINADYCLPDEPIIFAKAQIFYYHWHFHRLKVSVPEKANLHFGDCLHLFGKITACETGSRDPFCLLNPKLTAKESDFTPQIFAAFFKKRLTNFREKLTEFYLRVLPYPESDLLAGIVLGEKKKMDKDFFASLQKTGTLHLIVASGYNLLVIGGLPAGILANIFGRRLALVFGFIFVWFYAGMVGFTPPVVRAALILSFLFLAQFLGKVFNHFRLLLIVFYLLLLVRPEWLIDVSFQLTAAACFGMLLGAKKFKKIAKIPVFGKDLAGSLGVQILAAPLILFYFGKNSLLGLLVNFLILPLVPWLMGIGLVSLLLFFLPPLAKLALFAAYPLLWWVSAVINGLSHLSFAELTLKLTFWQLTLTYILIFFLFFRALRKKGKNN